MANKIENRVCCQCGLSLSKTEYYKSNSDFHIDKLLPICKKCFNQDVKLYLENSNYKSRKKAMQRMCMAFDVYYDDDLFDKCDDNEDLYIVIGNYMKRLNMAQYKNKTFETTLHSGAVVLKDPDIKNSADDSEQIDAADIEKWGVGLSATDYKNLNAHFKYLTDANPHRDSNQEIFITDLCYTKMQQLRCITDGDMENYKKMGEYYNATFSKSGLKVSNETETNSDDCLGVWSARIAQYTPEEYYKNKELYRDHDGFMQYMKRFVLRPLRNLQYGTTDRDEEFYVKEVGDDVEFDADTDQIL